MAIGYACKTIGAEGTDIRNCILKNATEDRLMEIIEHNIASLNSAIDYNIKNRIRLFRISSDLIPFGSASVNEIKWWEAFSHELNYIGRKIRDNNMRVSMHPGQYTVLNSGRNEVVERAVADLTYHTMVLDSLGLDSTHKIVLHIGGAYEDKKLSAERFIKNHKRLDESIRRRLVIENDDRIYNIQDVLTIGIHMNIPVIFDNLHNEVNPPDEYKEELTWIEQCGHTWQRQDGIQKIHYSQQAKGRKRGSHSDTIGIDCFMDFYKRLNRDDIDIMLEVKDKNLSCIKCINCTAYATDYSALEKEWNRYRYTILERVPSVYVRINNMLSEPENISSLAFYRYVEQALVNTGDIESHVKALEYAWKYIGKAANKKEVEAFHRSLAGYQQQQTGVNIVKSRLKRLAEKYKLHDLTGSYYFIL